ncbi:hypothetical protein ACIBAI_13915 [Streptomyces sp. NPDC051041]|uniref:hypothetical protein n=1 Tax=Streptomyces sp. NPDC051041 TaxID=3365640 RepID=UPI0037B7F8FB
MSDGDDGRRDAPPRHELHEWREPTRTNEQQPKHSHAGNGTVNHGPDDQGPDVQGPDGLESDELALRRMLHQAVQGVEPRDGTLEYLRRAVPARRARKRQAAVGMAAAALFIGTAIPALVHVSHTTGPDANPSVAGHASQAQGGVGQGKDPGGGESTAGSGSGKAEGKDKGEAKEEDKDTVRDPDTGTGTGPDKGAGPSSSSAASTAACTAAQLGSATGSTAAPDSTGAVYGSFRVTNVSGAGCTVGGPGGVSVLAQGAADQAKLGTARHVAGDAAAGLPAPSQEAAQLVLAPGAAYEVKFAWVPSETCPTTGGGTDGGTGGGAGTVDPTPEPTPTEGTSADGGTTTDTETGTAAQLMTADGPADGSVVVTYTAETGAASATVTVPNACAGTVYWTGLLAGA